MAVIRLDNEGRRKAIVDAAVPLFARKGFAGTTTKEIAEAALVSEALVFKHFPSKAALYEEILRLGCLGDPGLEHLNQLEPSTAALVCVVHKMLRYFIYGAGGAADLDTKHRMMVNSFLADGEYARLVLDWVMARIYPKIAACLEAADAAGDLVDLPIAHANRFWFGQHIAAMLAYARQPGRGSVPYQGDTDQVIAEAAWFILRGFGIKDEVIARHVAEAGAGGPENDDRAAGAAPLASAEVNGG